MSKRPLPIIHQLALAILVIGGVIVLLRSRAPVRSSASSRSPDAKVGTEIDSQSASSPTTPVRACPPCEVCPEVPEEEPEPDYRPEEWKHEAFIRYGKEADTFPSVDLNGDGKVEKVGAKMLEDGTYRIEAVDGDTGETLVVDWPQKGGETPETDIPSVRHGSLNIDAEDVRHQLFVCFGGMDAGRRCYVVEHFDGELRKVGSVGDGIGTDGRGHVFGADDFVDTWRTYASYNYSPGKPLKHKEGRLFSMRQRFSAGGKIRRFIDGPVWWETKSTLESIAVTRGGKQRWYLVHWGTGEFGWVPHSEVYAWMGDEIMVSN